jgi:hypothetical protein
MFPKVALMVSGPRPPSRPICCGALRCSYRCDSIESRREPRDAGARHWTAVAIGPGPCGRSRGRLHAGRLELSGPLRLRLGGPRCRADGVRVDVAMVRTPDDRGRLELTKFHSAMSAGPRASSLRWPSSSAEAFKARRDARADLRVRDPKVFVPTRNATLPTSNCSVVS